MRSCICGSDREMHIPKLAREWRLGSQSSSVASPCSSAHSVDLSSNSPPASTDFSVTQEENDLIHAAFNERARSSLGIPNKPQVTHLQLPLEFSYYHHNEVAYESGNLTFWQGKLDGVEDGLLNALSFSDSWHSTPSSSTSGSPTDSTNSFAMSDKLDISLGSMSAQEEARRRIEAYCRR